MSRRSLDRDIARLAIPALGALVAEPIFLLTDTAMVGHLGAEPQAGLAIASTVLQTVLGLMIFLAYATTPRVARMMGSGDMRGAVSAGIDGLWLAALTGVVLAGAGVLAAAPVVAAFGPPTDGVAEAGTTYLLISLAGLPAMLMVIAGTGLLRGLQDTKTPLWVASAGCLVNVGLNAVLIYGAGLGIAGSALGTVLTQWAMLAVYLIIAARAAARYGSPLRPDFRGVGRAAATSGWLLVRNAALRVAMLATVAAGTAMGVAELAALQITLTIFATIALALDSLAIAGQALIGHGLGAGNRAQVHAVTRRLLAWGLWCGVGAGILLAALAPFLGPVFSPDAGVREILPAALWAMAIGLPVAGYVFVLDGVLLGAGDARFLAFAGLGSTAAYLPMLWAATLLEASPAWSMAALWVAFGVGYMVARALPLGLRARGERWMITGATR
ncbi:MATE family efflux transporter [Sediminivirga luteola]|uniref:MATE family efflux transporter n=1 Tax=Sediminivirga luteola TaxID=1774748 RepID=A0A8J2U0G7_9MICO|nr:MATE family efflux transporter [Sediminivirga luteola]MCI2265376.1 MATE family efflux transporter [Sediminivirga luteola]GGA24446.1 MATE family efflux transporter [Sediminivirga luteola]